MPVTPSHCPYCGLQCAMNILVESDQVTVAGRDFPTNRGGLCQKGWTSAQLLQKPDRLTTPLWKNKNKFNPISWDDALDRIAEIILETCRRSGRDAIGVFGGGGLTNEKAYILGKFARIAVGTSQVDYNGRFCMSSAAAANNIAFGLDRGIPFPLTDLDNAEAIALIGANVGETMPPFMSHLNTAINSGGLIVADPRRTPTAERALAGGGVHMQLKAGTDVPLALGLLHLAIDKGMIDHEYISRRTQGFSTAEEVARLWWPTRTERITGVPIYQLEQVVEILAKARRNNRGSYILTARGAEQHENGTDTVLSIINLALALGLPGRVGSGYGCMTGQGNGQGGREHGQKADQLPGYRQITDPAAREYIAQIWGISSEDIPGPGRSVTEMLLSIGQPNGISMLLVHGSNLSISAPRAQQMRQQLADLECLVVADFFLSETAMLADCILPVRQWAEEEGTMTNLEGRVLRRRKAIPAPEGTKDELDIWAELAVRLGVSQEKFPRTADEVFRELCRASAGGKADYSAITYARLDAGEALYWPCSQANPAGTPRMFLEGFAHPGGLARFSTIRQEELTELSDDEYPLTAITGRLMAQYQSGAQTRKIAELNEATGAMNIRIHPETAQVYGLTPGAFACVTSRHGSLEAAILLDDSLRRDTIFLPFHFPDESTANLITSTQLDPISKMPEFKVTAVRIAPLTNENGVIHSERVKCL